MTHPSNVKRNKVEYDKEQQKNPNVLRALLLVSTIQHTFTNFHHVINKQNFRIKVNSRRNWNGGKNKKNEH